MSQTDMKPNQGNNVRQILRNGFFGFSIGVGIGVGFCLVVGVFGLPLFKHHPILVTTPHGQPILVNTPNGQHMVVRKY